MSDGRRYCRFWAVTPATLLACACSQDATLQLFPTCRSDCDARGISTGMGSSGSAATVTAAGTDSGGLGGSEATVTGSGGSGDSSSDSPDTSGVGAAGGTSAIGCPPLRDRVRVTALGLPGPVRPSDEWNPVVLAPRADGGSLVGYREAEQARVRVASLDAEDQLSGDALLSVPGLEVHALLAHDQGGALVYVRDDPEIFSETFCSATLCSSLELLRFDAGGSEVMTATLTDKVPVDDAGALFIYWFHHTARMVFAEDTYGIYFRSTRTIPYPVDLVPRPGDTLRFVTSSGERLDRGWDFGCAPSWSVRIEYNGA